MSKFGPTRSELLFRLAVSVAGLAMLSMARAWRGLPASPGGWEAVGLAGVFFGDTLLWTLRKLLRKDHAPQD